jgi:hypothetical protein
MLGGEVGGATAGDRERVGELAVAHRPLARALGHPQQRRVPVEAAQGLDDPPARPLLCGLVHRLSLGARR